MATRRTHQQYGEVWERLFPGVRVDERLESILATVKDAGFLEAFGPKNAEVPKLWVLRPWIEGETLAEKIAALSVDPAFRRSVVAQALVQAMEQLDELGPHGHGSLHPGNVIFGPGGLRLVDPVANTVRLGRPAEEQVSDPRQGPWLWGPNGFDRARAAGLGVERWDRLQLLRLGTLLAAGPEVWEQPETAAETAERCRSWARRMEGELPGDFLEGALGDLEPLLEALEHPEPVVGGGDLGARREAPKAGSGSGTASEVAAEADGPDAWLATVQRLLEEEVPGLASRDGGGMLSEELVDKIEVRALLEGVPAGEVQDCLQVHLETHDLWREKDLQRQADRFLAMGAAAGPGLAGSCERSARRVYELAGLGRAEAEERVRELQTRRAVGEA